MTPLAALYPDLPMVEIATGRIVDVISSAFY